MDPSKLKSIPQESKDDLLQQESFPDEETGNCKWIKVSGKHKGEACDRKTFDGSLYCHQHKALVMLQEDTPPSPKLQPRSCPPDLKQPPQLEIIPPSLLVPPHPHPPLSLPTRAPPPPKSSLPSTLTMPDILSILQIFSQTVIEQARALKKDPPS